MNLTNKNHNTYTIWTRLAISAALFMMLVGHTCPFDAPVRPVVFSVYVPMLFFMFGMDASEKAISSRSARRKFPWREIWGDVERFLLTLLIAAAVPRLVDFIRDGAPFSEIPARLRSFIDTLIWMSGVNVGDHLAIGLLWFLGALWFAATIWRITRYFAGDVVIMVVAVLLAGLAYFLGRQGIWLPLALDTAMVGVIFYTSGALFNGHREWFIRRRYLIGAVSAVIWGLCLWKGLFLEMAVRSYPSLFVFVEALAGILTILTIAYELSLRLPDVFHTVGAFGLYPVVFICMHHVDGYLSLWWPFEKWLFAAIMKFFIIGTASIAFMLGTTRIRSRYGNDLRFISKAGVFARRYNKFLDVAFYVAFAICYFRQFFGTTMFYMIVKDWRWFDFPYRYAVWVLILIFFVSLQKNESKMLTIIQLFVFYAGFFYWQCGGSFDIFVLCVLIVAISGKSIKPVLMISVVIGSILMIAAYEASINGYIPYLVYNTGGEYGSHAFGMIYRTDFGAHILYLVMALAVFRYKKLRSFEFMLFIFSTWIVWHYAYARMNTLCLILFLAGLAFLRLWDEFAKKPLKIPVWTVIIHIGCMISAYAAVMLLGSKGDFSVPAELGSLRARLNISKQAFSEYPIRLLGNIVPERGAGGIPDSSIPYFYLDISYVRTLIIYGLIILVIHVGTMTIASFRGLKQNELYLVLALAIVAVVSMVEHHATEFSYNVFILAAFAGEWNPEEVLPIHAKETAVVDSGELL